MASIFTRIINGELPADIFYRDERVIAFRDIHPLAQVHILIVPIKEIPTADDITPEDEVLVGHMLVVAQQVARQLGIGERGYRLIINCKGDGGQEVYHLHMHLLGGERLGPMLARKH
ncbi:MAG TPA: histidine triad nucleotide-binding protein [Candidatus Limnocylindrales bacterium]|nr:histidine triad nucleotide-binding protein [Candidatus Limnocylindrales bacterium]